MKNILTIPFFICGLVSTALFARLSDVNVHSYWYQWVPGPLFVLTALLVTLFSGVTLSLLNASIFAAANILLYALVFGGTALLGGAGFLVGIFTGVLGAYVFLRLANHYITPMRFSSLSVWMAGGLPFFLNFFFFISGLPGYIWQAHPGTDQLSISLAPVFLIWQTLVGRLYIHGLYLDRPD